MKEYYGHDKFGLGKYMYLACRWKLLAACSLPWSVYTSQTCIAEVLDFSTSKGIELYQVCLCCVFNDCVYSMELW